jgi:hypothetical protein
MPQQPADQERRQSQQDADFRNVESAGKRGAASSSCPRVAASHSSVAVAPHPIGAAQSASARSLLVLGADGRAPFSQGCAPVALSSSAEPEQTAAALSLGLFAVSAASARNFF